MKLSNLNNFNPEKIANIETLIWKAYYKHHFIKIFILLLKLTHTQFKSNYFNTFKISYYMTITATNFRMNRGKENKNVILKKLTKLFRIISNTIINKFDYKKAAELELE